MRASFRLLLCAVSAVSVLAPPAAWACMTDAPLVVTDIREADAVFSGRVIRYEIVSAQESGPPDIEYALITIRTQHVIRGDVRGDVQLYWKNSTFGLPEKLLVTDPALFAAIRADRDGLPLRGPSATVWASSRPDLLQLLQAPCAPPFMLPYSDGGRPDVEEVLKGGVAKADDIGAFAPAPVFRAVAAFRQQDNSRGSGFAAMTAWLALAVLVALAASWAGWRKGRSES